MRSQAAAILDAAPHNKKSDRQRMDMILMAIQGKKVGFDKVIKMIDNMVGLLTEEQLDDDHKKEYCEKQFDFADDKKKGLERTISQLESSIGSAKEGIATLTDDIAA